MKDSTQIMLEGNQRSELNTKENNNLSAQHKNGQRLFITLAPVPLPIR